MASYSSVLCASLVIVAALACRNTQGRWVPTEEEDAELEAQLKKLNKPAVKTIQSVISGELFDCVDIYKQPALDNPLLKDHKLQLSPSGGFPKELLRSSSRGKLGAAHLGYNDSCPTGTVLIRRTTKEDLIASKRIPSRLPRTSAGAIEKGRGEGVHTAVLCARSSAFTAFIADLTAWEIPSVKGNQDSASAAWIAGPTTADNGLGAGWHVYPRAYKDNKPRFFTSWTSDGYERTGCLNMLCRGFVQTCSIFGPGSLIPEESRNITIALYKDKNIEVWWVALGRMSIGYWPLLLFEGLPIGQEIDFGGQVYSPLDQESPPMGNGNFPGSGSTYYRNVQFGDRQRGLYTPDNKDLNFAVDLPDYYKIWKDLATDANFNVAYGGPGGYKSG